LRYATLLLLLTTTLRGVIMSASQPLPNLRSGAGLSRQTQRGLARLDEQTEIAVAVVQAEAEVQAAKAGAVGYVAQRGMLEVAYLSQVEQTLGQTAPLAGRLRAIGDLATLGISQIVTDSVFQLRRL
jgi:hypothetical protein